MKDLAPLLSTLIGGTNGSAISKAVGDVRLSYHFYVEMYKLNLLASRFSQGSRTVVTAQMSRVLF